MKKFLVVLLCFGLLFVSACSKPAMQEVDETEQNKIEEIDENASDFYKEYYGAKTRPVAVMIDNDNSDARPHAGLTDAYLVYEINVEGSATRYMALFNEAETKKIGPIRSSRHYFLDYVMEHDALYTHFGYSPQAMNDISSLGINNVNGVIGRDAAVFWREEKYKGDYHSAFTSIEKIMAQVDNLGYRTKREKTPLNINKEDTDIEGTPAQSVAYSYAGFYRSGFDYNADTKTYTRYINGSVHPIQEDAQWAVKNIIVMQVRNYPLGDGSPRINIDEVGTGTGKFITNGKCMDITWEKSSRSAKTVYKDTNGNEIALNPGQTWIMLIQSGTEAEIK